MGLKKADQDLKKKQGEWLSKLSSVYIRKNVGNI